MIKNVFTILFFTVYTLPLHAQFDKGKVVDKIIAKVDDYIILKSELERSYLEYLTSGQRMPGDAKCLILENLVINKLLVAKAEIDSVYVTDEEVESNLNRRMQYFISQIGSEEKIEAFYNKTITEFKEELRDNVREQLTVQRMQDEITLNVTVTPSEVKRFFNRIPEDSLPFISTEVSIAQIVKLPTVSKNQIQKAKDELNKIRNRILDGEDFAILASLYSDDPGSSKNGGELGFWKRGELAPEYEATALKLKPGEVSKPVETEFGVHIIELLERRGNVYNSRHILIQPKFSESDMNEAVDFLDSIRHQILEDSLQFQQAAIDYSDDSETSGSGGFFLDVSGSPKVSVEALDPVLFFMIDTMSVGDISGPMKFKTIDGKDAVRIIYYKSKTPPHQTNLNDDYQKIYTAALNEKKSKVLNEWFEKSKFDVFIDIDKEYNHCQLLE